MIGEAPWNLDILYNLGCCCWNLISMFKIRVLLLTGKKFQIIFIVNTILKFTKYTPFLFYSTLNVQKTSISSQALDDMGFYYLNSIIPLLHLSINSILLEWGQESNRLSANPEVETLTPYWATRVKITWEFCMKLD